MRRHRSQERPRSRERHRRQAPRDDDQIIIAVMGETGAGKSDFVRRVTGKDDVRVNHNVIPEPGNIAPYDFRLQSTDGLSFVNVRLIDCPGFDDTNMPDREIINSTLNYLDRTYRAGQKLHGIIYMIPISRPRMTGCTLANLSIFRELCGENFYSNVVLGTTHWDQLPDEALGEQRERELRTTPHFWGRMIDKGSKVVKIRREIQHRHQVGNNVSVASEDDFSIIRDIVDHHEPRWLQSQEQMARGMYASETSAMLEHDSWQDCFRRLEQERQRMQQDIDQRQIQLQTEREQLYATMNEEIRQRELQFAQDEARFQRRERGVRRLSTANAERNQNQHQGPGEQNIQRLVQDTNRMEAAIQQDEQDELNYVERKCKQHGGRRPTVPEFRCNGTSNTCNKTIDRRQDEYYRE